MKDRQLGTLKAAEARILRAENLLHEKACAFGMAEHAVELALIELSKARAEYALAEAKFRSSVYSSKEDAT